MFSSPILEAIQQKESDLCTSIIYSLLPEFKDLYEPEDWEDIGSFDLVNQLTFSAHCSLDPTYFESHPEDYRCGIVPIASWMANFLLARSEEDFYLGIDRWLNREPLDQRIDADPEIGREKLAALHHLYSGLNR